MCQCREIIVCECGGGSEQKASEDGRNARYIGSGAVAGAVLGGMLAGPIGAAIGAAVTAKACKDRVEKYGEPEWPF